MRREPTEIEFKVLEEMGAAAKRVIRGDEKLSPWGYFNELMGISTESLRALLKEREENETRRPADG